MCVSVVFICMVLVLMCIVMEERSMQWGGVSTLFVPHSYHHLQERSLSLCVIGMHASTTTY